MKVQLLSEYIDSPIAFTIPTTDKDIEYLKDYSITIDNFSDTTILAADSIYKKFNSPEKIIIINFSHPLEMSSKMKISP